VSHAALRIVPIAVVLLLAALLWPVESNAAQFTLSWVDNSTNEDGFAIERATGTGGAFAQVGTVGANVTSFTDTGLGAATTYCYRVRAFSAAAGNSPYSNQACATTGAPTVSLAVVKTGTGSGTVSSAPAGITCGSICSSNYTSGSSLTLNASAAAGSTFTGWTGGGCSGTGSCSVTLSAATTVTANFDQTTTSTPTPPPPTTSGTTTGTTQAPPPPPPVTLTVSKVGTGSGTVTSTPAGIACGTTCTKNYANGLSLTLNAAPSAGSTFTGWAGGGCSGTGTCSVSLTSSTTVTANAPAITGITTTGPATLLSFGGSVGSNPTYRWTAVSTAKWYFMQVNNGGRVRIARWISAVEAGCGSGTGTCSYTPRTNLNPGTSWWFIKTWTGVDGVWSDAMSFTVAP